MGYVVHLPRYKPEQLSIRRTAKRCRDSQFAGSGGQWILRDENRYAENSRTVNATEPTQGAGMGEAPRVSVIIPAYRVTAFIRDTLESVFSQTYTDFEVILVNDGCPDTPGLEAAIEPYRDRLRYIVRENGGPAAARNTGILAARGSLIGQLDGDDQWLPEFLATQVAMFDRNPEVDVSFTDAVIVGGRDNGLRLFDITGTRGAASLAALLELKVVFLTSSMVARKTNLERVGLYDEELGISEDYDLLLRLAASGARFDYVREVLVRYRRYEGSLSSDHVRMLHAGLTILNKVERTYALAPEERAAIDKGRSRIRDELSYYQGVAALRRGEASVAARELGAVRHWRSPFRLGVLRFGLRVVPRLTVAAYQRFRGK